MSPLGQLTALLLVLIPAATAAVAGGNVPATPAAARAPSQEDLSIPCENRPGVLGVSRIIEVDTSGGPRFGQKTPDADTLLNDKEVALTFDDGPMRRYSRPILDALDAECAKATFFIVGRMALSDPATLQDMARRGHTIGTHTWSHKRLDKISAAAAQQEVELGISTISLALGAPVAPFFRFPYLAESSAVRSHLAQRGMANFSIDVDSKDFLTRNPAVMRTNVLKQLAKRGKGIILFHDIQPSTASGLPSLLAELKAGGYKVVHLVPKAPGTTVASFDAIAVKEAQRRKLVQAPAGLQPASATPEQLPWQDAPAEAPPPTLPPPVKPRLKPAVDEAPWFINPLGR